MSKWKPLAKGFTLIELLIVMVLLGILISIATGSYGSSSRRGRDNRRKSDLRNIATALEAYYSDKGNYPDDNASGEMVGCCTSLGCGDTQVCSWGGTFQDTKGTIYMVSIPKDPVDLQKYYYASNGTGYTLYARMENTKDEGLGVDQAGYTDTYNSRDTSCSLGAAVKCTYGISSSNATP